MQNTNPPSKYINRITKLAAAVGHVGLKLCHQRSFNQQVVTRGDLLDKVVWPFVRRAGEATVVFASQDLQVHQLLQEILSPARTGAILKIDDACTRRYEGFWNGKFFSTDRTVLIPLTFTQIEREPILAQSSDPFIMQNISSFMGRRGIRAVARMAVESPDGVACALVGTSDDLFVFGSPDVLRELVPIIFDRCNYSAQYQTFAKGPFVPIDEVLKQIRPKKEAKQRSSENK